MRNSPSSSTGFTIVESLVALAIVTVVGLIFVSGLDGFRRMSRASLGMSSADREINEILENVRSSVESNQVMFDSSPEAKEKMLDPNDLPMAWDVGVHAPVDQCSGCGGRYGYVIQPFQGGGMSGLYLITLRMTHRNWKESHKDYQFVVTTK
ncbi:MAG TPA: hypothetical protein PL182_07325 [Pseudobdellovibrionaceae bacterium]|nr:hypothetical protein [Pseudobdellovibrionaceae bacterium]